MNSKKIIPKTYLNTNEKYNCKNLYTMKGTTQTSYMTAIIENIIIFLIIFLSISFFIPMQDINIGSTKGMYIQLQLNIISS